MAKYAEPKRATGDSGGAMDASEAARIIGRKSRLSSHSRSAACTRLSSSLACETLPTGEPFMRVFRVRLLHARLALPLAAAIVASLATAATPKKPAKFDRRRGNGRKGAESQQLATSAARPAPRPPIIEYCPQPQKFQRTATLCNPRNRRGGRTCVTIPSSPPQTPR